jgi:CheY-like chemotaxis protein
MSKDKLDSTDAPEKEPDAPRPHDSVFTSIKNYASRLMRTEPTPATILIVDDEAAVLSFVERVLSDAGYKTTVASDGPEAIKAAEQLGKFDVLVTDVMMPQMTGDELARRLRQNEPKLKVLYLTGYSDRLFKEKSQLWADEAFLDKPCTVKGLREAVALLLFGRFDSPSEGKP